MIGRKMAALAALLVLVASAGWARADEDKVIEVDDGKRKVRIVRGGGEGGMGAKPGRMSLAAAMRLGDVLKLDDAGTIKLYQAMRRNEDAGREARKKAREAHKALREALEKDEKSEAKLKDLMAKLNDQVASARKAREKGLDDVKSQLTVAQQARLMVEMPKIHRELGRMARIAVRARGMRAPEAPDAPEAPEAPRPRGRRGAMAPTAPVSPESPSAGLMDRERLLAWTDESSDEDDDDVFAWLDDEDDGLEEREVIIHKIQ